MLTRSMRAELLQIFDGVLRLDPLDTEEALNVMREAAEVTDDVVQAAQAMLAGKTIPIKRLLTVVDMAREAQGSSIASAASLREAFHACGVDVA